MFQDIYRAAKDLSYLRLTPLHPKSASSTSLSANTSLLHPRFSFPALRLGSCVPPAHATRSLTSA